MAVTYCGLDVGSSVCYVTAKTVSGGKLFTQEFATSKEELQAVVAKIPGDEIHLHLEVGEMTAWIRRILLSCPRVGRVVVSNPKTNAWIAKDAHKSDEVDSDKLADLLRLGLADRYAVYYADDPNDAVFKQVVQHHQKLTRQQARLKMRLKSFLRSQGVIVKDDTVYTKKGREKYITMLTFTPARDIVRQMYDVLDHTVEAQQAALRLMRREAKRYPVVAQLDRVPGLGIINACRFVAYVQDPHRFSSKRKLWRYARLGICHRTSNGETIGRESLDWNGNGTLKDVSNTSFRGALKRKDDNLFKRTYRASLQRTQSETHARLNTQRKILTVLWTMWKEGTDYLDQKG